MLSTPSVWPLAHAWCYGRLHLSRADVRDVSLSVHVLQTAVSHAFMHHHHHNNNNNNNLSTTTTTTKRQLANRLDLQTSHEQSTMKPMAPELGAAETPGAAAQVSGKLRVELQGRSNNAGLRPSRRRSRDDALVVAVANTVGSRRLLQV